MFNNWKTTVAGLAAGGFNLFANGMNWKQVLLSVGIAFVGLVAKDHNVTGGTITQ
jgi:hypothetical protein